MNFHDQMHPNNGCKNQETLRWIAFLLWKKLDEQGKIIKTDNEMFAYINIENVSDIKKIYDAIGIDLIISFPEDEEHMIIEIYDDYRE